MASNFSMSSRGPARQLGGMFDAPDVGNVKSGGVGAAAGINNINAVFSAMREKAPKYDQIAATSMSTRSKERQAAIQAESQIAAAGIGAAASVKSANIQAEAMKDAAAKQASAAQSSAGIGAIGSVIGAGLSLFSDESTKHGILKIDDALRMLRDLRPVQFFYKEEYSSSPERMHYGFIAQEYQKVMPDATYFDESTEKLCIDPVELIGLLVRSVQQLETRIAYLEAQRSLAGVK